MQKKEPGRASVRSAKEPAARDKAVSQEGVLPFDGQDRARSSISAIPLHAGAQLGLLGLLLTSALILFWIIRAPFDSARSIGQYILSPPEAISMQVLASALVVGGIAYAAALGRYRHLFTAAGFLTHYGFALYIAYLTKSELNGVALLWLIGASALLLFTYCRDTPLALLGIFHVYSSSALLINRLPLPGAICLFLLWTSFFSLIAILLKCRPLAWGGLYCAPIFFHAAFLGILKHESLPLDPLQIWKLFGCQIFQMLMFGMSIAGYTGSFNQRITPRQTWLYFPITLLGYISLSHMLTRFGTAQMLLFDAVSLCLLYGTFIAVASRFLQAPLSDLTMVHALSAIASLRALHTIALWVLANPLHLEGRALDFVRIVGAILGILATLALGISCCMASDQTWARCWNRAWSRLTLLNVSGLSLYGFWSLFHGSWWYHSPLSKHGSLAIASCLIGLGYWLVFRKAISIKPRPDSPFFRFGLAALFAMLCACWTVGAKHASEVAAARLLSTPPDPLNLR